MWWLMWIGRWENEKKDSDQQGDQKWVFWGAVVWSIDPVVLQLHSRWVRRPLLSGDLGTFRTPPLLIMTPRYQKLSPTLSEPDKPLSDVSGRSLSHCICHTRNLSSLVFRGIHYTSCVSITVKHGKSTNLFCARWIKPFSDGIRVLSCCLLLTNNWVLAKLTLKPRDSRFDHSIS